MCVVMTEMADVCRYLAKVARAASVEALAVTRSSFLGAALIGIILEGRVKSKGREE